jgi:hypothetical protein
VHKHIKQLVGVLVFLTAILLSPVAATGQVIPAFSMRSTAPNAGSYEPITGRQRMQWFVRSTVGAESLAAGTFSAGFGTARNRPEEYGPHWDGFGKRYAMRFTGVATSHAIEGAAGSLWGEDPRYFRAAGQPFKGRMKNVVVMSFAARQSNGMLAPAYARYLGNAGSNFLSNTWRANSASGAGDAGVRILLGFAGKMGSNAFAEFWPDARRYIFRRKH